MNLQAILGKPLPDFIRDRGLALFDGLAAPVAVALLMFAYTRISKRTFLVRYSLRTRLTVAVVAIAVVVALGFYLGANPLLLLATSFLGFGILGHWILSDVSRVGITNAFATTEQGISAAASLKEVRRELIFLGIGGKKLTDSPEFDKMLERCAKAGGSVRFLLSHPDNEALQDLATRNQHHDLSYQSRVKESIREIFTRASRVGVGFEIRLYNLNQKISLPHFRLMFIDDRLCIFSQVYWSRAEGLDNPQLILRPDKDNAASSLYQGYRTYFDDLWDLDTTKPVDAALLASWPS